VLLRPARGAWDWAAASNLFIPVENLEAEAITLLLRIESDPGRDLRAKAVIAPHSATNHVADDPEGILGSICSAVGTSANNNAASSGHCAVVIGPKHARTIAGKGWTRHDVRNYLAMHAYNLFSEISFNGRYGKIYNRNLPK